MKNKALVKDYEKLADEFGQNLLTKLRQHSVDYGFLDYWVADTDIKKGLISMVESAKLSLYKEIEINFMKKSVSDKELITLKENLKRYGKLTIFARQSKYVLTVKFLEQQEKNTKIFSNNTIKFKSKNINKDNVIKTEEFYLKSSFEKYINTLKNTSNLMYSYDNCNQNENLISLENTKILNYIANLIKKVKFLTNYTSKKLIMIN